jgi:hypothetical protein
MAKTSNTIHAMRSFLVSCFISGAVGAAPAAATGMTTKMLVGCCVVLVSISLSETEKNAVQKRAFYGISWLPDLGSNQLDGGTVCNKVLR